MLDENHKTKLTEAKIRLAQEQRVRASRKTPDRSGRLPSGQSKVNGLPVLDLGVQPEIALEDWKLIIDGCVEHPLLIDWGQLQALKQVEVLSDIHCVTSWSSFDNRWTGVKLGTLLEIASPSTRATHAMLHSYDGYTTNVPLADLLNETCLIATTWNGESLSVSHGGPARVVIPHRYFWKSAKWLSRIELMAGDAPGYWEQRGYHNEGDPWEEQRYGKRTAPEAVTEETPSESQAPTAALVLAPAPSRLARLRAWVSYHFFPD